MIRRIGITGGIGAGKSAVSERLRSLGALVIDADACSREVVEPGQEGLIKLEERFGKEILTPSGELNRYKLAGIIFANEQERLAVEAILHPLVIQRMLDIEQEYRRKCNDAPVFFEVPLLFETGMDKMMDDVWLISADIEVRVERIKKRDGCTEMEALSRIHSQMPLSEQRKYAHKEIDNSEDLSALYDKVDMLCRELVR